jgi:O-antigen/teichoic acid export membrane protein
MRRTFLSNLALVLALNLLVKPFYVLGIDAEVQVRAGAEVYGGYAALLGLSFMLNILLDLGLTNHGTRHIAQHGQLLSKHLGALMGLRAVLVLLYAAATGITAFVLGYGWEQMDMLAVLVLNQALASSVLYLRSAVAATQRFKQDSLLSVLDRALLVVLCSGVLWGHWLAEPQGIEWFIWAQTLAYVVALAVAWVFVQRASGGVQLSWKPLFYLSILRESLPFALLVLLMMVHFRADMVLLERLLPNGPLHAGIYAQAFRFLEAFAMLGFLFAGLLLPMFSRLLKNGEDPDQLTGLAWRIMLALSLGVAVFGSFWSEPIMAWRYPDHVASASRALALVSWSFVAMGTTYVFGTLLTAAGQVRALNRVAMTVLLLNLVLNLWAIPAGREWGAATVGLFTQTILALLQVRMAVVKQRLSSVRWVVPRALAYVVGLMLLGALLRQVSMGLLPALLWLALGALLLAHATGLLRISAFGQWLRQSLSTRQF